MQLQRNASGEGGPKTEIGIKEKPCEPLPAPDTVGDWLRRMGDPQTGQTGLAGLGQVRDALTARLLRRDGVAEYTLDVDATLIEAEKRDAQWSYQEVKGYMPLLGFLFETPLQTKTIQSIRWLLVEVGGS